MFKPVTGAALQDFDEQTQRLYAKRQSDPRFTEALLTAPRTTRNYLPLVADPETPYLK